MRPPPRWPVPHLLLVEGRVLGSWGAQTKGPTVQTDPPAADSPSGHRLALSRVPAGRGALARFYGVGD